MPYDEVKDELLKIRYTTWCNIRQCQAIDKAIELVEIAMQKEKFEKGEL